MAWALTQKPRDSTTMILASYFVDKLKGGGDHLAQLQATSDRNCR